MSSSRLTIKGARVHNLKNVDLTLRKNELIVFTGVSGSGKSSLAFDTLYAEGQRRYVESLSSYARQFIGQMEKPDVDSITGLPPAISIEQKSAARNPRSTVGTLTEIHDYLRVLYARVGTRHCPQCGRRIGAQTRQEIVARVLALPEGTRIHVLAPVVRGQKGEYRDLLEEMSRHGYVRARVDGEIVPLTVNLRLDRHRKHDLEIVTDRLVLKRDVRPRLAEAVENALKLGEDTVIVAAEGRRDLLLSSSSACPDCGLSFAEPTPALFSFNTPQGMCPRCQGLGRTYEIDPERLVLNPRRTVGEYPLRLMHQSHWWRHYYEGVGLAFGFDLNTRWRDLTPEQKHVFLYGAGDARLEFQFRNRRGRWRFSHYDRWVGIIPELQERYGRARSQTLKRKIEELMAVQTCPDCDGDRLRPEARAVRLGGKSLPEVSRMPLADCARFFRRLRLNPTQSRIAEEALKEVRGRLDFLLNVGLPYLTLDRTAPTLSGGEAQRIRLAGQIGCGLVGVLYILDEPSIGLHPRDNRRLLRTLQDLRDVGNTVIVVEHDEDTMRAADTLVDFGPGPGAQGGEVVVKGSLRALIRSRRSVTGRYLKGEEEIPVPARRPVTNQPFLRLVGARHNNLKNLEVRFPLGTFVCVTGVSGSGKSSLLSDTLYPALREALHHDDVSPGAFDGLEGVNHLDKVLNIDQSPIGRTPRSNPATYVKVFDPIRRLFAELPEARRRGYKPGRFSFNVEGGRCEACQGNGANRLEMDFLADLWVPCPVCEGKRFNRETLAIEYKGANIADVLDMEVARAVDHFANQPQIRRMLETLHEVGMDYVKLGQPSPTLSGGEAQRIKLARELVKQSTGRTLYLLDEPTTGLHFDDLRKLLQVLHGLVDRGNTVIVIEHNLEVVKTADWVIDLGPEGGEAGGWVVAEGTPEEVAAVKASHTGRVLRKVLRGRRRTPRKQGGKDAGSALKKPPRRERTTLSVRGARQHNLKDLDVDLPRNRFVVFSGVSGSGKSSLALDTLYAEGQRRYVESLSAYARQFLSQMPKPKVEQVMGLSPAIAIEQKAVAKSPRSTVGTVTEVYDYLRVLFAQLGKPYCPACGGEVGSMTTSEVIQAVLRLTPGLRVYLLAPVEPRGNESYDRLFARLHRDGYARIRVDGEIVPLANAPALDRRRRHEVEVVLDRLVLKAADSERIADSVEQGLALGQGSLCVHPVDRGEDLWYNQLYSCQECGEAYEKLTPHNFSFNSPLGWCPTCEGLGTQRGMDPVRLLPRPDRSLREGAVTLWGPLGDDLFTGLLEAVARRHGFSLDAPVGDLSPEARRVLLYGTGEAWYSVPGGEGVEGAGLRFRYRGLFPTIEWASRLRWGLRRQLGYLMADVPCPACGGSRLRPDAAAMRFHGRTLAELCALSLAECQEFFQTVDLTSREQEIAGEVLREIRNRLRFLVEVGLDYVTLDRPAPTLSGGETQRIRLASQIGSGLTGVLYVLDEPTIGLHPRDNARLLAALTRLRDLGNTVVVVEHDRDTLEAADRVVDFGPGGGPTGGEIVAQGTPRKVAGVRTSQTGRYLRGELAIPVPQNRRRPGGRWLEVMGARHNNLKDLTVRFPCGLLTCVTGVSGSGKSSLINDTLFPFVGRELHRANINPGVCDGVRGVEHLDRVIHIDQQPIGTSPRSNLVSYLGAFEPIRNLYAELPEAKMRGYGPGRFSFNRPGGRCEACRGLGCKLIEMQFLADVWVTCDSCRGTRYNEETLAVTFRGKSMADVLESSVDEALALFRNVPQIRRLLQTAHEVGLGYLKLGQPAPTLSGGEAQRLKLARQLARPAPGRTLYLLDEPTTGLHAADVKQLLEVLHRLVDLGNTMIVIEHNLEVVKTADWVIDLGPGAGDAGGWVVAEGPPEVVAETPGDRAEKPSYTAPLLKRELERSPRVVREPWKPEPEEENEPGLDALPELQKPVQPPWEVDGRGWHTGNRRTPGGEEPGWEGEALGWLIDFATETGGFAPADWNHPRRVDLRAPGATVAFLIAATDHPHWFRVTVRTVKDEFSQRRLASELKLKTWNERRDVPCFGAWPRVKIQKTKSRYDQVILFLHDRDEIDRPAFRRFLKRAAKSYRKLTMQETEKKRRKLHRPKRKTGKPAPA